MLAPLLVFCIAQTLAQGQQTPIAIANSEARHAITPSVKRFAQEAVFNGSVPGMTLGVVHSDGVVEFEGFGNKTEDGQRMTIDTLFNVASCSKNFLASALGILMDDFAHGRNVTPLPKGVTELRWYTKVKDILPDDWKLMDDWATEKATFRDILSHQSGVPRHELSYTASDSALDVIRRMRHLRPAFELRQRYHYNNQMYMLGAHVIEKYSRMPYPEFAQARIFRPLNMSTTTYSANEASKAGLLTQSWTNFGRRIPFWSTDDRLGINAGPGGIISSVVDLAKWLQVLLNSGVDPVTSSIIIPSETFEMATSAQIIARKKARYPDFSVSGYGLGLARESYQGHEVLTHDGGLPGFTAQLYILPSDGLGIVSLANADQKGDSQLAVVYRVIEDYLGLEHIASTRYSSALASGGNAQSTSVNLEPSKHSRIPVHGPLALPEYGIPLHDLTATYTNPGYPSVTLCEPKSLSDVPECKPVFETFALLEDLSASNDTLYCTLSSLWVSHGRFRRDAGNRFRLSATYVFPEGYGKDKTPFETDSQGMVDALFVAEDGVVKGLAVNGFVGELTERQRIGGTPQDTAEIWYEKV